MREGWDRFPFQAVGWQSAELKDLVGDHYQQRISEIRHGYGGAAKMRIENVPKHDERGKRLDGSYRYVPFEPLGRDSTKPDPDAWPTSENFGAVFQLTPPE